MCRFGICTLAFTTLLFPSRAGRGLGRGAPPLGRERGFWCHGVPPAAWFCAHPPCPPNFVTPEGRRDIAPFPCLGPASAVVASDLGAARSADKKQKAAGLVTRGGHAHLVPSYESIRSLLCTKHNGCVAPQQSKGTSRAERGRPLPSVSMVVSPCCGGLAFGASTLFPWTLSSLLQESSLERAWLKVATRWLSKNEPWENGSQQKQLIYRWRKPCVTPGHAVDTRARSFFSALCAPPGRG